MPPDELAAVLARARSNATLTMADAAVLLRVSLGRLYLMARETGCVAGVPVIRVGAKNLRIPSRPLLTVLGMLEVDDVQ